MDIDPSTFPSPSAPPLSKENENKEQSFADIMAAVAASARAEEAAELKEIEKRASSKVTIENYFKDICFTVDVFFSFDLILRFTLSNFIRFHSFLLNSFVIIITLLAFLTQFTDNVLFLL